MTETWKEGQVFFLLNITRSQSSHSQTGFTDSSNLISLLGRLNKSMCVPRNLAKEDWVCNSCLYWKESWSWVGKRPVCVCCGRQRGQCDTLGVCCKHSGALPRSSLGLRHSFPDARNVPALRDALPIGMPSSGVDRIHWLADGGLQRYSPILSFGVNSFQMATPTADQRMGPAEAFVGTLQFKFSRPIPASLLSQEPPAC